MFDSENTVKKAILFSGGSPRELLRIYEEAAFNTDEKSGKITLSDINKAIDFLAAECAHYLTAENLELLKEIDDNNKKGKITPYSEGLRQLLEHLVVMEYNDGTYKRINPVVEASQIYKQHVKQ